MQLSVFSILCVSLLKSEKSDYLFYGLIFLFIISFLVASFRFLDCHYFKLSRCQRKLNQIDHQIVEEIKKLSV